MKKVIFSALAIVAIALGGFAWFGANSDVPNIPIQMVAANSLSNEEVNALGMVSPKDSKVEKITIDPEIKNFIDKNYSKRKVYKITFNHTATESHGDLMVFVDIDKKTVVGRGFN